MSVATLRAFGDESGINNTGDWVIIAGYVGSPKVWAKFRKDWATTLRKYGVPEFHGVEFFPRQRREHVDWYSGWSDQKASVFLGHLLRHLNAHYVRTIGAAVKVSDWEALNHSQRRFLSGGIINMQARIEEDGNVSLAGAFRTDGAPSRPYMPALHGFITEALLATPDDGTLTQIILDRHRTYENGALQVFDQQFASADAAERPPGLERRLGDLSYADSAREEALQAADLYTYLWNRALRERVNSALLRQAYDGVNRPRQSRLRVMDKRHFDNALRSLGDDASRQIRRLKNADA